MLFCRYPHMKWFGESVVFASITLAPLSIKMRLTISLHSVLFYHMYLKYFERKKIINFQINCLFQVSWKWVLVCPFLFSQTWIWKWRSSSIINLRIFKKKVKTYILQIRNLEYIRSFSLQLKEHEIVPYFLIHIC